MLSRYSSSEEMKTEETKSKRKQKPLMGVLHTNMAVVLVVCKFDCYSCLSVLSLLAYW